MRSTAERTNNDKKINPSLKVLEGWGADEGNFFKKIFSIKKAIINIITAERTNNDKKINPSCNFFEDGGVGEESFLFKESFFPHEKKN